MKPKSVFKVQASKQDSSDDEGGAEVFGPYHNNKWYPSHLNFPCHIDNHKHELSSCAEFFAMISQTGEVIPGSELTNIPEVSEHSFT